MFNRQPRIPKLMRLLLLYIPVIFFNLVVEFRNKLRNKDAVLREPKRCMRRTKFDNVIRRRDSLRVGQEDIEYLA